MFLSSSKILKLIVPGITSLQGRTNYGDSIEDEWVIVYLLRELTKRHKDIWVKVVDSDGEFLLVEAAGTLPAWIEPEIADNRVSHNTSSLLGLKGLGLIGFVNLLGVVTSRRPSNYQA